ncbi:MAG: hypothetical protein COX65_09580 [Elusimicrobia bacterium CG_4_10_14_0_2_um_filter_56_8]|nr:MAG: hypothetical protein AUJ51_00185 [Elusimicrobia bacterium CG1_02_56_21]PJA11821.1 MAG: hypothetical protein COX65_09580 [Elusimicrobia bacterium CG_4_10_14_0_2_um_filter_56_8]
MRGRGLHLLAAAALTWGAGGFAARNFRSPFPPPSEMRVPAAGATGDMLALALGARRLFSDVWFIRLMQYYGTVEVHDDKEPQARGAAEPAGHEGHHHEHGEFGTGNYPEFFSRARHVLEVDHSFVAAGLYGAASLAFNMQRAGEAEELLRYGLRYSPREWKYLSVLAAIGYSKADNPAAVAQAIAPLLKDPDCPVMLKQQAAFLNKKQGNYALAAAIYADILATSHDEAYVNNARKQLELLSRHEIPPK